MTLHRRRNGRIPVWRRGFPFFLGKPRTAVERLRSTTASQAWRQGPRWRKAFLASAMSMGWPVATLFDAVKLSMRRTEGRPGVFALYRAALTRNIPPNQYARYATMFGKQGARIEDFLLPLDLAGLYHLNRQRGAIAETVQDKARFEAVCRAHNISCIPTLATFEDGMSNGEDRLRAWNEPLFVKALSGNRGSGAELWRPERGRWVSNDGLELSFDDLIVRLRSGNQMVQPVLEDCPELRALGTVALSSVRIVTAKGSSVPATPIAASVSLATEKGAVTGHHGIQCGVDVETGRILNVETDANEPSDEEREPALIGFSLPFWAETINMTRDAHDEAFPAFVTLGWDVALTPDGPVLIETNVGWGMTQHQKLTGPLGQTALAEIIDELLAPETAGR